MLKFLSAIRPPALTSAEIAAIPSGRRPPGSIVFNTDAGEHQANVGSDATPVWASIAGGAIVGQVIEWPGIGLPVVAGQTFGWADGSAVSRTSNAKLLAAVTSTQGGTRTSGSPTITGLTSTAGLAVGTPVEGTGIPAGTTISVINSLSQVTLSANATSSGTSNITFFPHGNGDGSTTFNLPDRRGRVGVGAAFSGGHADVTGVGKTDGTILSARRVRHKHAVNFNDPGHAHSYTAPTGGNSAPGGALSAPSPNGATTSSATTGITVTVGPQTGSEPTDGAAHIVMAYAVRIA